MQLIIYTLNKCKTCESRQYAHNQLASVLEQMGIEVLGIMYGEINGKRYEPYPEHDQLCRKPNNPMVYMAPVYILQDEDITVKLADMGEYRTVDNYVEYLNGILEQLNNDDEEEGGEYH